MNTHFSGADVLILSIVLFLAGLVLAVRVMFFGVRRQRAEQFYHQAWPLALAALLVVLGALGYLRARSGVGVTAAWAAGVVLVALAAGAGAWWLVRRSAAIPSTDPEDDPRYRFQGHVARLVRPIGAGGAGGAEGRIAFDFDGVRQEFRARWSPESEAARHGIAGEEQDVVIEYVDGDVAYVEPWAMVEERL